MKKSARTHAIDLGLPSAPRSSSDVYKRDAKVIVRVINFIQFAADVCTKIGRTTARVERSQDISERRENGPKQKYEIFFRAKASIQTTTAAATARNRRNPPALIYLYTYSRQAKKEEEARRIYEEKLE